MHFLIIMKMLMILHFSDVYIGKQSTLLKEFSDFIELYLHEAKHEKRKHHTFEICRVNNILDCLRSATHVLITASKLVYM